MLFYLTNLFLDVVWGTAFWVIKKTSGGVYYLIWGNGTTELQNEGEYEMIILSKENIENDEHINKLLEQTKLQGEQIKLLTDSIMALKEEIKKEDGNK
jgi:hypothetical protein